MPGGRLTQDDRRQIAAGLAAGLGYAELGRRLDRPASTIMREVTRNGGPAGYAADRADADTRDRARRQKQAPVVAPPIMADEYGRDPEAVRGVAESFTELLIAQGLPKMEARVLTCLYLTDSGTLTAGDLVQRLRVSPASISHAIAFLEQQGILRRERDPGERRERYVVDDEIWLRSVLASVQMNNALAAQSRHAAEVLGPDTPAGVRFGASAELLDLVSEGLQQAMEKWRERLTYR
ncbi:helix-turn-helix domain-containing protein [Kribbella sandramycini]|uniref:DNA-binding transcriptional ArsR family regulator n=1 Tax=Kribbella sandramycini TaxID=60450 RepID=A0A7Y4P3U8_9ACTN|nr:helix-turn-helix domain-containing protein [Kribbella sandramycini]MBB6570044.1 DNA-binding transcriptional ArsR family regulator [Kribbella sandramycini]NOL45453.1 helix-turn-helix domain-containing protein [Kribbella sandramycini]